MFNFNFENISLDLRKSVALKSLNFSIKIKNVLRNWSWTWRGRIAALPFVGGFIGGTNVSRFHLARWSAFDGPEERPRHSQILWLRSQRSARDEPLLEDHNIVLYPTDLPMKPTDHGPLRSSPGSVEASDHKLAKRQRDGATCQLDFVLLSNLM